MKCVELDMLRPMCIPVPIQNGFGFTDDAERLL